MKKLFVSVEIMSLALLISLTAAAQQRVALVIGNAAYVDPLPPLESPVNDARDMAAL